MTPEQHMAAPSRKTLFTLLAGGVLTAGAILVGVVLPAEYRIDPLGIGQATGLLRLASPKEVEVALPAGDSSNSFARVYPVAFRTDTVEIPLAAAGDADGRDDLEWKVRMQKGRTLIYSWTADAPPDEFYSDLHGESLPDKISGPDVKVVTYRKGSGVASNGAIVAAFDGIHGWYLQNQAEQPVVVKLKLSGFYELPDDPYAAAK
jgi:hypothetical protein